MGHTGAVLLSPAVKWVKGRYATAYHRYIQQPENAALLRSRRTAIEPVFDLIAQVLGTKAKQKQLPIQKLANVRTCLALATLTLTFRTLFRSSEAILEELPEEKRGRAIHGL